MPLGHYVWTAHARARLRERRLDRREVEEAIRAGHDRREVNDGRAQWVVHGRTAHGAAFEVVYDHPHGTDPDTARVVSAWRVDELAGNA